MAPSKADAKSMAELEALAQKARAGAQDTADTRADAMEVIDRLIRRLTGAIAAHAPRGERDIEAILPAVRDLSAALSIRAMMTGRPGAHHGHARAGAAPGWYIARRRRGGGARPAWWDGHRWWPTRPGAGGAA